MAPRPIHEPPHLQLRRLAIEARAEGLDFEAFWSRAVRQGQTLVMTNHPAPPEGAVRWPTDRDDRRGWQSAIYGTRDGWRRSYELAEAPLRERALAQLGEAFAALDVHAMRAAAAEAAKSAMSPQRGLPSAA